jgi:hypothetical protein
MHEVTTEVAVDSLRITDKVSLAIIEDYRRRLGDKTMGKTATRIVQAFHAMGGQLGPVASNPPEGQGAGVNAAPTPSATQPT